MSQEEKVPDFIREHLREYAENPQKAHDWDATFAGGRPNTPTLLLTTIGRKSGRPITVPLIYGKDSGGYVVVASKGGAPEHPAWYLNLEANPQVDVQVAEQRFKAVARTVTGAERERMWQMMSEIYPPYPEYQQRTEREIPVVILEPLH